MVPVLLQRARQGRQRGLLAMSLLFVGVLCLVHLLHLFQSAHREIPDTAAAKTATTVPPELMEFFQTGRLEEDEDKDGSAEETDRTAAVKSSMTALLPPADKEVVAPPLKPKKKKKAKPKPSKTHRTDAAATKETHSHQVVRHDGQPPLDRLVDADKITGKVDWLLDFAILGHAKCATSFVMNWLRQHESVQMWDYEVCDLNNRQPASLVRKLYQDLPAGADYLRGFKCPGHFSREPLRYFRQYFAQTKLIVGLRHPVRWFESYYNFRIRHPRGGLMPPPDRLLGPCVHASQGVCTDRANFHRNLAMLAKTNHSAPDQLALLTGLPTKYQQGLSEIANPVFLYDVSQLHDGDAPRRAQFQADLETFMGLDTPLPANYSEPRSSGSEKEDKFAKLDICHGDFDAIRAELVAIGSRAATWITRYFVPSDSVVVSAPAHFAEILQGWHSDPCDRAL